MQCDAELKVHDQDRKYVITFFCLKDMGHDGEHEHLLKWERQTQILTAGE